VTVRMIIDTDTASDDAVALAMALRHPGVRVLAITTVAGNCSVEQATRNALFTTELCESDVPVHQGAAGPLLVPASFATWFHGQDGLGDQGYPPPLRRREATDAITALVATIRANPGCTVVTLGPLTNVVMALRLQRERMAAGLLPSTPEYVARYQLTEEALRHAHPEALVMHPGPMNRDLEIAGELADSERSVIEAQVANGVPVRMAVLYTLLVGKG